MHSGVLCVFGAALEHQSRFNAFAAHLFKIWSAFQATGGSAPSDCVERSSFHVDHGVQAKLTILCPLLKLDVRRGEVREKKIAVSTN